MNNLIINSPTELKQINDLLGKNLPAYRQAYSDRTAWLMACLSELAYIRFNPLFSSSEQKQWFVKNVEKLVNENSKQSLLQLISTVGYDHIAEKEKLEHELSSLKIQLVETFDNNGTQCILISLNINSRKHIALAFRGTEATSVNDIKADLKSNLTQCKTGGRIHSGFKEAFEEVGLNIQNKIDEEEFQDAPLFITGHSLGGALATIAAKDLKHEGGIAACYTFGSPRVGNDEWGAYFKTPIYRLVNAADCVTMLPPGDECLTVVSWILRGISWLRIPFISRPASIVDKWLLSKFAGYLHAGNMRYMTDCKNGQYHDVKILYSVSLFRRIKGWFIKKRPWKKFLADHSISVYRKKLMVIALQRN